MNTVKLSILSGAAMIAFAANSLLCRMALIETEISPAEFTFWRVLSGAIVLAGLVIARHNKPLNDGDIVSGLALFVYAGGFSFAYVSMTTGAGALLLFGAVQLTMISWGIVRGERFNLMQWIGFIVAGIGLSLLLLPNASVPEFSNALLMIIAGISWGIYSLRGKGARMPIEATAGNFLRALPIAIVLLLIFWPTSGEIEVEGIALAVLSGALASGVGYALWYSILPHIVAVKAATLQLTVPVIAVFAGWLLLDEPVSMRVVISSSLVLGGVAFVIWTKTIRPNGAT